jgi:integrase
VSTGSLRPARKFLSRWPDPQAFAAEPLEARLEASTPDVQAFVAFLMVRGHLRPGYDYLLARHFTYLWRELEGSALGPDMERFVKAAAELGFARSSRTGTASQVVARVLVQSGKCLNELCEDAMRGAEEAVREAESRMARRLRHYSGSVFCARAVLYHLGVLPEAPSLLGAARQSWADRMAGVADAIRASFVAYLERLTGTHAPSTVSGRASRLASFGRFLAEIDPDLASLAELDRRRHIEPWLSSLTQARSSRSGLPVAVPERHNRILAVRSMLDDIAEWGWEEAPPRRLIFARDLPHLPRPLSRYLPIDADRRLVAVLEAWPRRLIADALLLQRACGLRSGELIDLELDCVDEIPGQGAWLKVPLGKFDTERMVPIDDETVALIDRIVTYRSPGRPLRHPRDGRLVEFLLTLQGHRISKELLRRELARAATEAGLDHAHPHQLRHTWATALVNQGVSLQSLMVLLGHQSPDMSLRYGKLFDSTVRAEYEKALALAKARLGPVLPAATPVELNTNWRDAPLIKARLAGGYCLRTAAQGVCAYSNICEFCPNFRTDNTFLAVLGAQRADAAALAADAEARGWGEEAARHRRLVERIEELMNRAQAV